MREGHTGRISAQGFDSTDQAQRGPYKKDWGLIFSQYGPEQAWLIRDLLHDWNLSSKRICILKIGTWKILWTQCAEKMLKKNKFVSQLSTQVFCRDFYEKYCSYFPPSWCNRKKSCAESRRIIRDNTRSAIGKMSAIGKILALVGPKIK